MSVRNWAAGAAAGVVVVAGLAAVQSGIRGTDVLPAARDGAGASAAQDGAGLPEPGEATAAPPTAGAVHGVRVVVRSAPRTAATAGVQTRPKGEKDDRSAKGKSDDGSDKHSGSNSGSDGKSGSAGSGDGSSGSGGSGDGGKGKSDSGKDG
jgi:hypothetical protein